MNLLNLINSSLANVYCSTTCQIMAQLGSKVSSRNLHMNCAIIILFCPHLILDAWIQIFDVMFLVKTFLDLKKEITD